MKRWTWVGLQIDQHLSDFQLSVVKPKPKQLLWPITRDEDISVNQSEFEVITCNRHQARENARVQLATGFVLLLSLRKWREFFQPITERSNAKPQKRE